MTNLCQRIIQSIIPSRKDSKRNLTTRDFVTLCDQSGNPLGCYVIYGGRFILWEIFSVGHDPLTSSFAKAAEMAQDRIARAVHRAESEWAAYWKSDLWC